MSTAPSFPPSDAARRMLDGNLGGLVESLAWTAARAGLLSAGMYVAGERDELWRKAFAGSLAVEAFVVGWALIAPADQRSSVPSYNIALNGSPLAIAGTFAARSAIVYGGMRAGGYHRKALRNALAGTAAIEAAVLVYAALTKPPAP